MMAWLVKLPHDALSALVVILAVALAISLYGSYQRGRELDLVCGEINMPTVVGVSSHFSISKAAAQQICYERQTD